MSYSSIDDTYTYGWNASPALAPMPAAPNPARPDTSLFYYPQNLQNALHLIQQAVSGEAEDRMFYSWLLDRAPSAADKQVIEGIRDDEIKHFGFFRQLYYELTGSQVPQMPGEQFTPPANYCDGLSRALMGEQNAVRRYRQILYAMQVREHFNMLTEIITDEIRHGILYGHLYAKNGCRG